MDSLKASCTKMAKQQSESVLGEEPRERKSEIVEPLCTYLDTLFRSSRPPCRMLLNLLKVSAYARRPSTLTSQSTRP